MKENNLPSYAQLIEYYTTTHGSYIIDSDPQEVDIDWIRENAYQPELLDSDKISKEAMAEADDFWGSRYLREKLVFSLLANWGAHPNVPDIAQKLYNYIIHGELPEDVANKTPTIINREGQKFVNPVGSDIANPKE